MRVNLSEINQKEFFVRPCVVAGDECFLVEPHGVGVANWNRHNLHLRSSIWNAEGNPVSLGFKKFFNEGEEQECYPKFKDLRGAEIMEKLDGSLLIVSAYKEQVIVRTRGTIDAEKTLGNGHELPALRAKYNLDSLAQAHPDISFLIEWFSPLNKIVINYADEPKLWLVGAVRHSDYALMSQDDLDGLAKIYGLDRPARYQFGSPEELRVAVEKFEGKEGVCVYYNRGQNILKLKSSKYLYLHYYKADVSTFDKVVDIWLSIGRPNYQTFYDFLSTKYDWEIAQYAAPMLSKICDAAAHIENVKKGMEAFIERELKGLARKDQFAKVVAAYGQTNRAGMVMSLLDGKGLSDQNFKKLCLQLMK